MQWKSYKIEKQLKCTHKHKRPAEIDIRDFHEDSCHASYWTITFKMQHFPVLHIRSSKVKFLRADPNGGCFKDGFLLRKCQQRATTSWAALQYFLPPLERGSFAFSGLLQNYAENFPSYFKGLLNTTEFGGKRWVWLIQEKAVLQALWRLKRTINSFSTCGSDNADLLSSFTSFATLRTLG